jgi:hypothetical protein
MPNRITSLDLGNGGEYYGSCKQVLSQSNGSTSDFKSTSTKVSSSQPSANNSSDDSSKGDPSQGKVWASENNGVGKNQPTDKTNLKNISIVEKRSEGIQTVEYGPIAKSLTTWQPKHVRLSTSFESGSSSSSSENNTCARKSY